jgi:hypothetical protein
VDDAPEIEAASIEDLAGREPTPASKPAARVADDVPPAPATMPSEPPDADEAATERPPAAAKDVIPDSGDEEPPSADEPEPATAPADVPEMAAAFVEGEDLLEVQDDEFQFVDGTGKAEKHAEPADHEPASPEPAITPTTPSVAVAPSADPAPAVSSVVVEERPLPPAEAAPRGGISPAVAIFGMIIVGAICFAAAWLLKPASPSAEGIAGDTQPVAASPTPQPEPTALTATSPPTESAEPGAAPDTSTPSAAPTPSEQPSAEPPVVEEPAAAEKLLSYQGFLIVNSQAKADVYVQGKRVGPTNAKNISSCWTRFVRLRDPSSQRWLTKGQPVRIECMKTTTVTINPTP